MTKPKAFIAVNLTPAMSGYFATLYDYSWMEGGTDIHGKDYPGQWFAEPYETGFGRYPTPEQANAEGARWAEAEGLEFFPATPERIAEAEAHSAALRKRIKRIKELRDTEGLGLGEARDRAIKEGL